jgi:hypothetical protein
LGRKPLYSARGPSLTQISRPTSSGHRCGSGGRMFLEKKGRRSEEIG